MKLWNAFEDRVEQASRFHKRNENRGWMLFTKAFNASNEFLSLLLAVKSSLRQKFRTAIVSVKVIQATGLQRKSEILFENISNVTNKSLYRFCDTFLATTSNRKHRADRLLTHYEFEETFDLRKAKSSRIMSHV